LQYVAICCSEVHFVALCSSVLQYVAVCCSMLRCVAVSLQSSVWNLEESRFWDVAVFYIYYIVLQCAALCCSVL